MNYSVLMSVYIKDNALYFEEAIKSILNQSVLTDDFVLVCDGPLTDDLNKVISKYEHLNYLNIVRLNENLGLGKALNIGLSHCKNELVMRMDSDDISLVDRAKIQLNIFKKHEEISFSSGTLIEYDLDYQKMISAKRLPKTSLEINKYAKKRNPINHPCVMFKKSAVIASGSYQDFYLFEDYYLWVRLIQNNFLGFNVEEPILHMRAGLEQIKRRGGYKYFKSTKKFQKYLLKSKFISLPRYLLNILIRFTATTLMPNRLRAYLYKRALR